MLALRLSLQSSQEGLFLRFPMLLVFIDGPSAMLAQRTQGVLDTDCYSREVFCSTGVPGLSSEIVSGRESTLGSRAMCYLWYLSDALRMAPRLKFQILDRPRHDVDFLVISLLS